METKMINENNIDTLSTLINIDTLIPALETANIFPLEWIVQFQNGDIPISTRTRVMLHYISRSHRSPNTEEKFIKCLRATKQDEALRELYPDEIQPPYNGEPWKQENMYKMNSDPRGLAIIINNIRWEGEKMRWGAEKDHPKMQELLEYLGYEVDVKLNQKKEEMSGILKAFAQNPRLERLDSGVICIMSHGNGQGCLGSDDQVLEWKSIYGFFNNSECPGLREKPKIFFFQACRGVDYNYVVERNYEDENNDVPPPPPPPPPPGQIMNDGGSGGTEPVVDNKLENMLIFHSTLPDYLSHRTQDGAWFIQKLYKVFNEEAHRMHLADLCTRVKKDLQEMRESADKSEKCFTQTGETNTKGGFKTLYFNPPKVTKW